MSPAPGTHRAPADAAASGPRRPGGHAEVRLRRRAQRARAGLGARDGGARRRGHLRQGAAGASGRGGPLPRGAARPGGDQGDRRGPRPHDLARIDESPVRCFDAEAEAAMVAEVEAAAKAGDSLGGVVEVLAYGVPVGARQPRPLGPQARRTARAGAHEHPGGEGRRAGRGLRRGRPPGLGGPRPDQLGRRGGRVPPRLRPRRRHRGRDVDRRAARRPAPP